MPINLNQKKPSFNEKYYLNKFTEKQIELNEYLKKKPNDLAIKEQIQFIDNLLKSGDNSEWAAIWKEWEKNNFYWPNINKNGH